MYLYVVGEQKRWFLGCFSISLWLVCLVCLANYLFIVNECIRIHCETQFKGAGNLMIPAAEQMQKRQLESGYRSDFACCFWHLLISVHVAVALECCMTFPRFPQFCSAYCYHNIWDSADADIRFAFIGGCLKSRES